MTFGIEGLTVLLQVFDMPGSIAFYRDVMGFRTVETSQPRDDGGFDWAMLGRDGMRLMLNTAYESDARPEAPDCERVAAHEDTALFFSCRDLDAAYLHLRACGVDAQEPSVAAYGMRQVWLKDPDGYVICLQWPA